MPIKRSTWTAILILNPLALSALAQDTAAEEDAFAQFAAQQQAEFEQFEREHWQAFEQFVNEWREAEAAYKEQLAEVWEDPELSDRTRYIQYSDDVSERTVVDYEANTVTVEVQGRLTQAQLRQKLQQQLTKLARTTVSSALKSDPVIKQLPKPVQQQITVENSTPIIETETEAEASREEPAQDQLETTASTSKITVQLPPTSQQARIKRVLPTVEVYAQKHGLSPALILAIIHTESSFNPMARSHIPAFGLMQIVPTSAGKDISDFLYGEQQLFSPAYLFDPDNNIQAGSVYYYLLSRRYFKAVRNDEVRELLSIAAYNTGPGNVARTFGSDYSLAEASAAANQMTREQAYQHLMTYLPAQETKNYLRKITQRQINYQQMMEAF
ncbi:membrane-bound lytic murein transglycosylase C [Idiomarina fontislapidosi]|uniref:Murein transglycosylase n=1 Tax=Idiomarina fontislapidosi TaxID=263723 RepID=A0A432YAP5_9GAMM|nr:transglycosylase SLT domain-containing protein [Idiomarina fontislapidosi]PYE35154.1 membrane-bound lytic murein transglycosylase C [Idiomarina fontislapidosi]RUO58049.1 murein transglycosylase [Idiomarina fontislapidosi]